MKHLKYMIAAALAATALGCATIPPPETSPGAMLDGPVPIPRVAGEERVFAGIVMVWVPPGTFMMGSPKGEPERDPEDEIHRAVVIERGFWISKYEVTQAQWEAVMGVIPATFRGLNPRSAKLSLRP